MHFRNVLPDKSDTHSPFQTVRKEEIGELVGYLVKFPKGEGLAFFDLRRGTFFQTEAVQKNAPLGVVVCADSSKCDVWVEDASIATIFLHLAATSMGLGSCWLQIRKRMLHFLK